MTEKRRKRRIQLYMKLKEAIKEINFSCDLAEVITNAIDENITTTQINQLNISLTNKLKEYRKEIQR